MKLLGSLEAESVQIIREVFSRFQRVGLLFSGGKDATILLHLVKKSLFPTQPHFDLIHIDSGQSGQEIFDFIDKTIKLQYAPLVASTVEEMVAQDPDFKHFPVSKLQLYVLRKVLRTEKYEVLLSGTRNQESGKNLWRPVFQRMQFDDPSKFDQNETDLTPHRGGLLSQSGSEFFKVHPLSRWTEKDTWNYIKQEKLPLLPLYYGHKNPKVENKVRIRSLREYYLGQWLVSGADDPEKILLENRQIDLQKRSSVIKAVKRSIAA